MNHIFYIACSMGYFIFIIIISNLLNFGNYGVRSISFIAEFEKIFEKFVEKIFEKFDEFEKKF